MDKKKDSKEKNDKSPIHKSLIEAVSEIKIGKEDISEIEDEYDLSNSEGFITDEDHFVEINTGRSLKDLLNVPQDDHDTSEIIDTSFLGSKSESSPGNSSNGDLFTSKSISDVYLTVKDEVEKEMAQHEDGPLKKTPASSRSLLVNEFCSELHRILIGRKISNLELSDYFEELDGTSLEEFPEWTRGALIRSIDVLHGKG